jgi:beta-barrel assembly-enhancing protease
MKRAAFLFAFVCILGISLAGLYYSQRRTKSTQVSANALVNIAADAQRDLSRAPLQFTRISDEEEIAIGNQLAARYVGEAQKLTPEEEAMQTYVRRVGASVAVHAHRKLPYNFHLIADHNLINAFSLPGGPVFIGEGLLDLMVTDDELANILAHEVEHIDHYHCAERVQIEAKLKKLNLEVVSDLLQFPMQFWEAGYQKDEEFEADREGMHLAVQSGYSPYGAVTLFERFTKLCDEKTIEAEDPAQELSQLAMESLTGYFRSHPLPSERLAQANRVIAEEHWESRKMQTPIRLEFEVHDGRTVR